MDKKALGKQLQKYRKKAQYSQDDVAAQIGCSSIFISCIERGVKAPALDTLIELANILDVSIDVLIGKEVKDYYIAELKNIEKHITSLPLEEQQRTLELINAIVMVEVEYCSGKRPRKE